MWPDGTEGSLQALDSLMLLAIFTFVSGIASLQMQAPPEDEPWYQYEGALRGF